MSPHRGQPTNTDVSHLAELLDSGSLAEFAASTGYGITIRQATGEYLFANHRAMDIFGVDNVAALTAAHLDLEPSSEPATTLVKLPDGQVRSIEHSDSEVRMRAGTNRSSASCARSAATN